MNFKKLKKGKLKNFSYNNVLNFGCFGLKSMESGIISFNQLESARKILTKKTNRKIKVWKKISKNTVITKKSTGSRMGKGVGKFVCLKFKIKKDSIIFEIMGVNKKKLVNALKLCRYKLPVKTKIVYN